MGRTLTTGDCPQTEIFHNMQWGKPGGRRRLYRSHRPCWKWTPKCRLLAGEAVWKRHG